jgi:hypothetical protein
MPIVWVARPPICEKIASLSGSIDANHAVVHANVVQNAMRELHSPCAGDWRAVERVSREILSAYQCGKDGARLSGLHYILMGWVGGGSSSIAGG